MKRIILYISLFAIFTLSSCSSTQTISIHGKPGTTIYTSDMKKIATIPESGESQIEISKDITCNYLLSIDKDGDKAIPFALDFENRSCNGPKIAENICLGLLFPSIGGLITGTILIILEGYSVVSIASSGLLLATTLTGANSSSTALEDQYKYRFKYLPEQTTNQDIVFTPLKQTADYKTLGKKTERRKFSSGNSQSSKDPISIITGTYSGKGELSDGNDVIEEYSDIKIVIRKKDKNTVIIEILASDGYSYFDEEILYSVTKQDNQFVLKQKGANSRIVIKDGSLSYTNHNINDGDMIYTLKITAEK